MGLFSSSKSSTTNQSTSNFYDQRSVVDASGGGIVGDGNSVDASNDYTYVDSSQKTTTINGTDPGVVRIAELNSQFLQAANEQQTDAVRALAGFGADSLRNVGQSVTNLYDRAGSNQLQAWQSTLNASSDLITQSLAASGKTTDAARAIAAAAMDTYQPAENKAQDVSLKLGVIVAAGVALVFMMRKG